MCPADPPSYLLQDAFMAEVENTSLDAEIVKEPTGIFAESCRVGQLVALTRHQRRWSRSRGTTWAEAVECFPVSVTYWFVPAGTSRRVLVPQSGL